LFMHHPFPSTVPRKDKIYEKKEHLEKQDIAKR